MNFTSLNICHPLALIKYFFSPNNLPTEISDHVYGSWRFANRDAIFGISYIYASGWGTVCELIPQLVVVWSETGRERREKIIFLGAEASKGTTSAFKDLKGSKQCTLVIFLCKISADRGNRGRLRESIVMTLCSAVHCNAKVTLCVWEYYRLNVQLVG